MDNAWKAALKSVSRMKVLKSNREAGLIVTDWKDNTRELNFSDSFQKSDDIYAAKFRLTINLYSGSSGGIPATQVRVRKVQLVERDLSQGWRRVDTGQITENTLIYRIGRILEIERALDEIHKAKEKEALGEDGASDDQNS